jgi:origin recognition complex subunit 2
MKRKSSEDEDSASGNEHDTVDTPSKRGRGRPKGSKNRAKPPSATSTPVKSRTGNTYETPKGSRTSQLRNDAPDADRSARRKSARTIIERTIADDASDNDEDEYLAREIYDSDEDEGRISGADDAVIERGDDHDTSTAATPSKRGRGRPKGSRNRRRSPTPVKDLPPHELYFVQNRARGSKTSDNNLSSLSLLDHGEYFSLMRGFEDPHTEDIEFLNDFHSRSFTRWQFELSQGFNICLYGWGSKRKLLNSFAEHVYNSQADHDSNALVVVNGYLQNVSIRDVLKTCAIAIGEHPPKLGSQVPEVLDTVLRMLGENPAKHLTLLIHSIDIGPLRKPAIQPFLAQLASHPQISVVISTDHPSFPLLWDSSLRSSFNFVFHDCTTFRPYEAEVDVVNEVHELLGRSGRRIGGKEGVSFVLKSLNRNSRMLFQLLVTEQLAAMDEGALGDADQDIDEHDEGTAQTNGAKRGDQGIEYRLLYQKAAAEFICGDEVSFRTLLREFHDHQMIKSRKDATGTEMLSIPFSKHELEAILEDLVN